VTPKEQEIAIGEIEERVDRLRVLYDQYFLGFEKLEPTVPRKDVDRRMAILRKEQIRNTALRFRLNVVTQKYNTYGMYWIRISRQIEEGTFKRHIRRAEARFGGRRERDLSIDVDITEFDDFEVDMDQEMDMDAVLAEANAAAEAYDKSDASDTMPPAAPTSERVPASVQPRAARQMVVGTPGTSFVAGGQREVLDARDTSPPPDSTPMRAARPAPLPPGAKPRVVLRKVVKGPDSEGGPAAGPSSQRTPAPMPGARPAPAPSTGRIPIAAPGSAPAGVQSERRIPAAPAAPLGSANMPARPAISRIGAARPAAPPAQSTGRIPVAAPAAPGSRPNAPPAAPGSQPSAPAAKPAARPSIPDDSERDTIPPGPTSGPASRPSIPPRSRAPLPLPSQVKKK